MYTLHNAALFQDTLCLESHNGTSETIEVHFHVTPELVKQFRALQVKIAQASQNKAPTAQEDAMQATMDASIELVRLLFGEDNTNKLLEYYSGDLTAMASELFPYIRDVVTPAIHKAAKQRMKHYTRPRLFR